MLRTLRRTTVVLCLVTPLAAHAAEETLHEQFAQCILHQGPGGHVWVSEPLVSLGMIGVMEQPAFRLSPTLAARLRPLVNVLKEAQKTPCLWFWGLPRTSDRDKPLVVVWIECDANLRASPGQLHEYEISALELLKAEFITGGWREAWDGLDKGLKEIVAASRTAPGAAKRERLKGAVEQASRSLGVMAQTRVEPQSRDFVRRLAPKARVVRTMQKSLEEQWGRQLRQYVARLRLSPRTPLPPEARPCPKLELLAASSSPAELLAKIRRNWPEDVLDESLIYAQGMKRTLAVWEVEGLAAEQFQTVRAQAKDELSRAEAERKRGVKPEPEPTSLEIAAWGAVVRAASADLLAEKGLLGGAVVESVSANAPDVGLRRGDVIIDYRSVYDLTMAQHPAFAPLRQVESIARYGGKLDILRGDRVLTVEVKPR